MSTLMRSSAVMATGTLVSRVLGFVRASLLTGLLGVQGALAYDTFATANTVPNNIYMLIAGGLLNAVLVPQIARAAKHEDGGEDYLNRLLTVSLLALAAVTVVVTALAPLVPVIWGTSRWDARTDLLAVAFALWCLPQIFFYGVYTLFGQVLNAAGRFGAYMWAPVANNVVGIGGLILMIHWIGRADAHPHPPASWTAGQIAVLAGTATAGVVVQALVLFVPLRSMGFRYRPRWGLRGVGLSSAGKVAGWTFAMALLGQLGFIITTRVVNAAGATGAAGRAAYDNAYLLFFLPHSLVTVSLVTALFTRMSHAAADGDTSAVRRDVSVGLRLTGVATVLATAGMVALASDLTATLFFTNSRSDTDAIARTTVMMMLGLVPFSAQYLFQRAFYAYEDARTPFMVQIPVVITMVVTSVLALALPPSWIVAGVGLGMSLAYAVGAGLSFVLLRRRLGRVDGARVSGTYLRLLVAGVLAALVGLVVSHGVHAALGQSRTSSMLALVVAGAAVVAAYLAACRVMRIEELGELLEPIRSRLARA